MSRLREEEIERIIDLLMHQNLCVIDSYDIGEGYSVGGTNLLKKELTRLFKYQASQSEENDLKHLYEWLMNESREPAQTKFTSGMLRNVAKEIEFRLREKVLSDMMRKDEELGLYDETFNTKEK